MFKVNRVDPVIFLQSRALASLVGGASTLATEDDAMMMMMMMMMMIDVLFSRGVGR